MTPPSNRSRQRRQSKSGRAAQGNSTGQLRIIAGRWRGRRLPIADVPGLRPTGDRVRETLFNWLQPHVAGAHCLDLFAGSGALGFEALSRQAASVTFVEPDADAFALLQQSAAQLDAGDAARLVRGTAEAFLAGNERQHDLVFIDPPFDLALQWDMLERLGQGHHLAAQALVYVESPANQAEPPVWPQKFRIVREKVSGEVRTRLLVLEELA